jgi:hypothetical protein
LLSQRLECTRKQGVRLRNEFFSSVLGKKDVRLDIKFAGSSAATCSVEWYMHDFAGSVSMEEFGSELVHIIKDFASLKSGFFA